MTEGFESHLCPQSACRQNQEVIAATMRKGSIGKQEVRFAGRMYADGVNGSTPLVNGGRVRIPLHSIDGQVPELENVEYGITIIR